MLNGVEFWTRHNGTFDQYYSPPCSDFPNGFVALPSCLPKVFFFHLTLLFFQSFSLRPNLKQDYNLVMPDPADPGTYHSNKYITHPPVPGEVEAYESVEDQAEEMRRWFHAWQDEDPKCPSCVAVDDERERNGLGRFDEPNTERYYPEFFKPVLCVMEGAWIKQSLDFEESFESDRHFVDAKDWRELYDKNRFLYQSGRKSTQENLPFLPLSVRGLEGTTANETTPAFANWEYRIICTPLKEYVPLYNFRVSSDLAIQLGATSNDMLTLEELSDSRRARFDLNHKNQTSWVEGKFSFGLIDDLMYQVPGKDGYSANLRDDAFGAVATEIESDADGNKPELNTAFYTRYYSIGTKDAMGRSQHRRGFNDPTLWAAMTTHDKIQGVTSCTAELINGAGGECTEDVIKSQKWTWAVPLEIIYTTPLGQWNPYNLEYCVEGKDSSKCKTSKGPKGVRTGALSVDYAFDGVARDAWFVTPEEFFSGTNEEVDVADTSGGVTGVLDPAGVLRKTRAAGHWVHWPAIKGFDKPVRQRFPIMPIHEHGKTSWKEVKALQDLVVDAGGSAKMRANLDKVREERLGVALTLAYTTGGTTGVGPHTHSLHISGEQTALLNKGESVTVSTSLDNGHTHDVTVARDQVIFRDGYPEYTYKLMQCDRMAVCGDPEARAAHETALAEAVSKHEPWGVYTNAAENFKSVRGGDFAFWNDTSGNGHHTIKITTPIRNEKARKACQLHDAPPATAAVLCGREQGLVFPNGSIPAEFTIFSRAQFAKDTVDVPLYQRYITRDANDKRWYGGFSGYGVGRTVLANGKTPTTQCAVSKEDAKGAYNVVANRNVRDNSQYVTFVNSEPMAIRNDWWGTTAAAEESQLAIGAIWESASQKDYGSDFLITDLLIFDKHLDDAAIKEISDLLQQQGVVERPQPCCWDGHKTVQVSR